MANRIEPGGVDAGNSIDFGNSSDVGNSIDSGNAIDLADVIELGEVTDAPATPDDAKPPTQRWRGAISVVVACACLFGVAAAAPARAGLDGPLWTSTVSLAGFTLGQRNVYLYEPNGSTAIAKDRFTGAERWRVDLPDLPMWIADLGHGVTGIAIRGSTRRADGSVTGESILLIDDATGAEIARLDDTYAIGRTTSGRLLVDEDAWRSVGCSGASPGECTKLAAYDVRSGAPVWRAELPGFLLLSSISRVGRWSPDSGGLDLSPQVAPRRVERFTTVTEAGRVTIRDAGTGDVLREITIPGLITSGQYRISVVSDTVYTVEDRYAADSTGEVDVTVRRWLPRPQWTSTLTGLPEPSFRFGLLALNECGAVLCLHLGGGTALLDRDAGTQSRVIDYDVLAYLGGGQLLAGVVEVSYPGNYGAPVYLIDPRDGGVRATYPSSSVVPWMESNGRALVVGRGAHRTQFTLLDRDGHRNPLGSVPGVDLTCSAHADILACSDRAGKLRVWRLPP